jgi:hypothetical protein
MTVNTVSVDIFTEEPEGTADAMGDVSCEGVAATCTAPSVKSVSSVPSFVADGNGLFCTVVLGLGVPVTATDALISTALATSFELAAAANINGVASDIANTTAVKGNLFFLRLSRRKQCIFASTAFEDLPVFARFSLDCIAGCSFIMLVLLSLLFSKMITLKFYFPGNITIVLQCTQKRQTFLTYSKFY